MREPASLKISQSAVTKCPSLDPSPSLSDSTWCLLPSTLSFLLNSSSRWSRHSFSLTLISLRSRHWVSPLRKCKEGLRRLTTEIVAWIPNWDPPACLQRYNHLKQSPSLPSCLIDQGPVSLCMVTHPQPLCIPFWIAYLFTLVPFPWRCSAYPSSNLPSALLVSYCQYSPVCWHSGLLFIPCIALAPIFPEIHFLL